MIKKFLLLSVLCSAAAFAQFTQISDTLKNTDGSNFNGQVNISWPEYIMYSGLQVPAGKMLPLSILNGVFNVSLHPNDRMTCVQTCAYLVTYTSIGNIPISQTWIVPTSATPVSIALVNGSGTASGATNATNLPYTIPGGVLQTQAVKNSQILNVNDYGAKGDGVTDDAAAWQLALNSAPAGATVMGSPGATYLLNSQNTQSGNTCSAATEQSVHINFNGSTVTAPNLSGGFLFCLHTKFGFTYENNSAACKTAGTCNVNTVSRGDTTVTLGGGNTQTYGIGDLVYVRGVTTNNNNSEFNIVAGVSGSIVTMQTPFAKTMSAAPTMIDVQALTDFDYSIENGKVLSGNTEFLGAQQIAGLRMSHVILKTTTVLNHEPVQMNYIYGALFDGNDITSNSGNLIEFGGRTCTNCRAIGNTLALVNSTVAQSGCGSPPCPPHAAAVNIGEGAVRAVVTGNTITSPGVANTNTVDMTASYDSIFNDNSVITGPNTNAAAITTFNGSAGSQPYSPAVNHNTVVTSATSAIQLGAADQSTASDNIITTLSGASRAYYAYNGPSSISGGTITTASGTLTYGVLVNNSPANTTGTTVKGVTIAAGSTCTNGIYITDPGSQQAQDPILQTNQVNACTNPIVFANAANNANRYVVGNQGVADVAPVMYAAGAGSANVQTVAYSPALKGLIPGVTYKWLPSNANTTTTPTLNINALGAKTIVKSPNAAALVAGDLSTSIIAMVVYDGTNFELQNPQGVAAITGVVKILQETIPAVDCLCAHPSDASVVVNSAVQQAYVPAGAPGGSGYTNADTWVGTGGTCTTQPAGALTVSGGAITGLSVVTPGVCTVFPTGITPTSGGSGALVAFSSCNNTVDTVSSTTLFNTTYSILGGSLVVGNRFLVSGDFSIWSSSTAETVSNMPKLKYATVNTVTHGVNPTVTASLTNASFQIKNNVTFTAVGASAFLRGNYAYVGFPGFTSTEYSTAGLLSVNTTGTQVLSYTANYLAHGVESGTYTSGITATGSTGQTCLLTAFNGAAGSGATATVYLTGTNTIAGGTALYITNTGIAYTGTSTSATVGNGTATCTGPATITTVLGGAQGNIMNLNAFTVIQEN